MKRTKTDMARRRSFSQHTPAEQQHIRETLTAKQFNVYVLHLAGCPQRQIATMLGYRSKGTVSHHLKAAEDALARHHQETA